MKSFFRVVVSSIFLLSFALPSQAQVARKVVIEHFTNTRCGICSFRNPDFFTNLEANPGVIHLAVHPSSPYSSCILNQHNRSENDARTNYYGIYGATPRLVAMGSVISPGRNFADATIITDELNQTSPFSLKVKEIRSGTDSVTVEVTLTRVAATEEISGLMYVAYAEDTIFYQAPNGEPEHYNVFREAFSGAQGSPIAFPVLGDSTVWQATIAQRPEWDMDRMFAIAMVQNASTQAIWQAETTSSVEEASTTSISASTHIFRIFPNPAKNILQVEGATQKMTLSTLHGQKIAAYSPTQKQIDLSELPTGMYLLQHGAQSLRVQVQR